MRILAVLFALVVTAAAQPPPAKRLPPAGVAIPEKDRAELTVGAAALGAEIESLRTALKAKPELLALLPDVEIFHKAVDWALRYDEFFNVKQVATAKTALQQGVERARQLRAGAAPWTEATGLVVRGYRSKLDGSVQPYGLTVPASWKRDDRMARRMDVWLLGRGETRSELGFIAERAKPAQFEPENTVVLTPYGRFCNATKFAGEVDVFEAIAAARKHYHTYGGKFVVRGFSMGGASTWHLATHHPGMWCAAAPGAGFAETPNYAKVFAPGKDFRPWWEQVLWRWYNATDYAGNLFNVPTVAYSGELDPQKLAADTMVAAAAAEGVKIEHLIGPKTEHKYEPATKAELARRIDELARNPRDPYRKEFRFTTYTLRYADCGWVKLFGLERHWERADVRATMVAPDTVRVETKNVSALSITYPGVKTAEIDGQTLAIPATTPGVLPALPPSVPPGGVIRAVSHTLLHKANGRWVAGPRNRGPRTLSKLPKLQGPIDDAFMERFLFVRPTGAPLNGTVGGWVQGELAHSMKMWRDIFRGDAPVKDDTAVTDDDIANSNLVLWGDPSSNRLIARLLDAAALNPDAIHPRLRHRDPLPLKWDAQTLEFRGYKVDAAHHAPVLIFPNPLNPSRYVVLNSGVTFREEAYGTNSLQAPKLPDWAIIDLRTPPGPRWPGLVFDAGFFDEQWR